MCEDGISQNVATFEEGNEGSQVGSDPSRPVSANDQPPAVPGKAPAHPPETTVSAESGANVFILFDTSNYMFRHRGFVFAQDAIAEFVRSLDHPYRVAFYSYSRDFFRAASLTEDRSQVLRGVRSTVNGDD